ncbi:MAG: Crp/Fnr family transcriptional regulator [Chloroflexota bacterium]
MAGTLDREIATDALRRCALFARVTDESLDACIASLRSRRYRRGETIFHQGDPGDSLYIVAAGSVKIVLPDPAGEEEAIIATLGKGDFFGELAILDGAPHSASIVALEPTETLVLHREPFEQLIDTDRSLRQALFAGLTGELRRLTGHVEELHFLDLPGRLARKLVQMAEEATAAGGGPVTLNWPYTQSELAAMIGGTRQTVNRLLADLVDQELIRIDRETITIPDLGRLARSAER